MRNNYLLLSILIIVAIFALWLQEDIKQHPAKDKLAEQRFPDYFMDNFITTSLNQKGQVAYTLEAQKMLHYEDDDSAELQQPKLVFHEKNSRFTLSASNAVYYEQQELLHLKGNVNILRASDNQTELSIKTDYLKINTASQLAETDQFAEVQSNQLKLSSQGLIYDNQKGSLILLSEVKGIYEATP